MGEQLSRTPEDAKINLELGEAAQSHGDLLRAEQYYQRAEALGVAPEKILPKILGVLVAAQRYAEALARCEKRLSLAPDDRPTRFVRSALLVALERPREAEHDLLLLIDHKPDDAAAYLALGKLYRDALHDQMRARPQFERFLSLAPNDGEALSVRFQLESEKIP